MKVNQDLYRTLRDEYMGTAVTVYLRINNMHHNAIMGFAFSTLEEYDKDPQRQKDRARDCLDSKKFVVGVKYEPPRMTALDCALEGVKILNAHSDPGIHRPTWLENFVQRKMLLLGAYRRNLMYTTRAELTA